MTTHDDPGPTLEAGHRTTAQFTGDPDATEVILGGRRASRSTETFAHYVEIEEINRGGFGRILRGVDPRTKREVAIKTLQPQAASPQAIAKFLVEGQVTAQLEHPNIIPIHEMGTAADGRRYLAMKLVRGRPLTRAIAEGVALGDLLRVFTKVCDAVAFAHSRGVVHRDLKPDNIMLGEFGEVLVLDWGLAKVRDRADPLHSTVRTDRSDDDPLRTLEGQIMGTPCYMPPEQAEGRIRDIDERADVYALGAILYHVLVGRPPYAGCRVPDMLRRIVEGDLEPPRKCAPGRDIDPELEAVAMRAMACAADARYPDVLSLERDIVRYLEGRTLDAVEYSAAQRVGKWVRRHRRGVAVAAALVALPLLALGAAAWKAERTRRGDVAAALREAAALRARAAAVVVPPPREGRPDSPERQVRGQALLGLRARVVSALERAIQLDRRAPALRRARREAGLVLGRTALELGAYSLAEQAFTGLAPYAPPEMVGRWIAEVGAARKASVRRWIARVDAWLARTDQGLGNDGETLADGVFEVVRYRHPDVVRHLAGALEPLHRALASKAAPPWSQAQRDRALFVCRTLGRMDLDEAVNPLARWLAVVTDPQLAIEAGVALCATRRAAAHAPLTKARARFGASSRVWSQIRRRFSLVPLPANATTSSDTAQARHERAMALRDQGRLDEALRELEAIVGADEPTTVAALLLSGVIHRERGDLERALACYERAREHAPDDLAIRVNRGNVLKELGRLGEARAEYDAALLSDPDNVLALYCRGRLRRDQGDTEGALADLGRAIAVQPRPDALRSRAVIYSRAGQPARALADVDRAIALDGDDSRSYVLRGQVLMRGRREVAVLDRRVIERALRDYDRAIALDGGNVTAYLSRGTARLRHGDRAGAMRDLQHAIQLAPNDVEARLALARAWYLGKDPGRARRELEVLLDRAPDHQTGLLLRAKIHLDANELARAEADIARAMSRAPRSVEALEVRALLAIKRGQLERARADFGQILEIEPRWAKAWTRRGQLHLDLQRLEDARADFEQALKLDPRSASAHCGLGVLRQRLGQLDAARTAFDRALAIQPDNLVALLNRGALHRQAGRLAAALVDLTRAVQLAPGQPDVRATRGMVHQQLGQTDEALADLREAVRLAPKNWRTRFNLGQMLCTVGRRTEGLAQLRQAYGQAPPAVRPKLDALMAKLGVSLD